MNNREKAIHELEDEIIAILATKKMTAGDAATAILSVLVGVICQVPTKKEAVNFYESITESVIEAMKEHYG